MDVEGAAETSWLSHSVPEGFLGATPAIFNCLAAQPILLGWDADLSLPRLACLHTSHQKLAEDLVSWIYKHYLTIAT